MPKIQFALYSTALQHLHNPLNVAIYKTAQLAKSGGRQRDPAASKGSKWRKREKQGREGPVCELLALLRKGGGGSARARGGRREEEGVRKNLHACLAPSVLSLPPVVGEPQAGFPKAGGAYV